MSNGLDASAPAPESSSSDPVVTPRICPACDSHGEIIGSFVDKDSNAYGLAPVPIPLRRCISCGLRFFDLIRGVNTDGEIYSRMTLSASAPKPRHYTFTRLIRRMWTSSAGLEVGAGRCHVGRLLDASRHSVIALDRYGTSEVRVPGVEFIDCDIGRVARDRFEHERFDWVLADNVLEHLPSFRWILDCSHVWLRPGGCMIVAVPNGNTLKRFLGAKHRAEMYRPVEHVNIFEGATLDSALARSGFRRKPVMFLPSSGFEFSVLLSLLGIAPFGLYRFYTKTSR